ncbi:CNNM domain-containing protein [bacterium]|nr:CNNM domain-containing protein [bacterium]
MTAVLAVSIISLIGSFICSLLEAVLNALSLAQIEVLKGQGIPQMDRLARLRSREDESFAALLTVNTVLRVAAATVCGGLVTQIYGQGWLGLFAFGFTLAVLIVAEYFPRRIAARTAAKLARYVVWPIQLVTWALYPLTAFWRLLVARTVSGGLTAETAPTENEIIISSRLAAQRGMLRPQEVRWLENALRLDEIRAEDLMTPRTVVYRLPADLPLSQVQQGSQHWVHSRLPVTEDRDPDHILGVVYRREVFDAIVFGRPVKKLRDLMHKVDFVPASMRGHQLLDRFITEKKHMAAVVDEYGAFIGVVTLEDVLECLLGSEIVDEHDRHVDMQQVAREKAQRYEEVLQSTPGEPGSADSGIRKR